MQYFGVEYRWSGNDYNGIDCSGFCLKVLSDVGIILPDMTADDIYKWAYYTFDQECEPGPDTLLFFGKPDKITHVAIGISETHMVEAAGSGRESMNMSREQLLKIDARVRIKSIKHRRDLVACVPIHY
jgi:cell wall-associated NlpC family hydrolase